MSATTVKISFQKELLSDIDEIARQESRSRSELLREAARQYIKRKRRWESLFACGRDQAKKEGIREADVACEVRAVRKRSES